jgi:DNA repair protein RadC
MNSATQTWRHPGGKLRELGPERLSDTELLAILISSGIKGKPAEKIAEDMLSKFGSFKAMANEPLEKFSAFKGISSVKTIRIAAAFEITRRLSNENPVHNGPGLHESLGTKRGPSVSSLD